MTPPNLTKLHQGFEKVPSYPGQGAKKGGAGLWRLTAHAVLHGVLSTTRYRKASKRKVNRRTGRPAPKRQASGRKGGQATRDASVRNRMQQARLRQATSAPNQHLGYRQYNRDSHYGSPYSYASSASPPASNMVSTPEFYPQDMFRDNSIPPMPFVTQAQSLAPAFPVGHGPVRSAIGQYELGHINPTAGLFRSFDTDSSPYLSVTTPEMTDDSFGSFYMTPCSREQSVQA
jgi:hypothetical protein